MGLFFVYAPIFVIIKLKIYRNGKNMAFKSPLKNNKKTKVIKVNNTAVVYFFVNRKRKIECRNCKLGVFLDAPTVNANGVETDLSDKVFATGSMAEFETHIKSHKSRKDKVFASNIKEVKAFFKRLA